VTLERSMHARKDRRIEYLTILWNSLEGSVAVFARAMAGSISLVGFGVDSMIEVTSGAALLWRMSADADPLRREWREAVSLRIVGGLFIALAAYVSYEAISPLSWPLATITTHLCLTRSRSEPTI